MNGDAQNIEPLQRRWNNTRFYLAEAAGRLRDRLGLQREGQTETGILGLDSFQGYLDANELELALDELNRLAENLAIEGEYWLLAALAARCMKMRDRSSTMLQRYHHGTTDQGLLQEITKIALQELRLKRFGVTQQFFQVHQLHENPVVMSRINVQRNRAETFIRVNDEPYYWVVKMESDHGGDWRVIWGYCSHRANVYLKISHDSMSAEAITDLLGICPDEFAVKGAPIQPRPGSRCFDSHRWYLNSPAAEFWNLKERLNDLLIAIEPVSDQLNQLQEQGDCLMTLAVALYDSVGWPMGYELSRSAIERMAAARLSIDFDLYHSGPVVPDE